MRTMLAGIVALAAMILGMDAARPVAAGEQFSIPDTRSNFVVRPWGARYTYRFTRYDLHSTWPTGPRNHFRFRREGIDLQLRDRWQTHVEVHQEPMK
jgi:hypothetical protein